MKACCFCAEAPHWHFLRNISMATKIDTFGFAGCKHADDFTGNKLSMTPAKERAAFEEKWDAHAEALFARYTALWTEPQRISFRARLWPEPPPVIPTELKLT